MSFPLVHMEFCIFKSTIIYEVALLFTEMTCSGLGDDCISLSVNRKYIWSFPNNLRTFSFSMIEPPQLLLLIIVLCLQLCSLV